MIRESIGFIGVGYMGHGMAKNIVEKGYPLTIVGHRNRAPVDDLVARGAVEVGTPREVAEASTIVFLCVTGSSQVEQVVRGEPDGLAAGLASGSVVVDCSTSEPASTLALAAGLARSGIAYADSPVSRTPVEAWAGTLDTMVGADDAVFARIRPVIETWATKIVHVGGLGDGHRMKLLNNLLSLGSAALFAEVFTLAQKVGISPRTLDDLISGGRLDSGFYQTFSGWIIDGDPDAHRFALGNAVKDLDYVERMAAAAGMVSAVAAAARGSFESAVVAGGADANLPLLVDYVGRSHGLAPHPASPLPGREA